MKKGADVLERSCLQAGKTFIRAGEGNARAYVIQNGEVASFVMEGGNKVEVERFGPGTIIGEKCLVIDEPSPLSYETITTATVVTITRDDFQRRLNKVDKSIKTILDHAIKKISDYESAEIKKAIKRSELDDQAIAMVDDLLSGLSNDKKKKYEAAILPHVNALIKEINIIKDDTNMDKDDTNQDVDQEL